MSIPSQPQQTLAEIALGARKKSYIAIETASRVTGYTVEYLKRLCELSRLEYRLRPDGSYAVPIEALLKETQTILISYDGIPFLDMEILIDPEPGVGDVVPAPLSSPISEVSEPSLHDGVEPKTMGALVRGVAMHPTEESRAGVLSFVGQPIFSEQGQSEKTDDASDLAVDSPASDTLEHNVVVLPRSASTSVLDFPVSSEVIRSSSIYRPLMTSVDPTLHHDAAPLFPLIPEKPAVSAVYTLDHEAPALALESSHEETPAKPSLSAHMTQLLRSVPELTGVLDQVELAQPNAPLLGTKITSLYQVHHENAVGVFHDKSKRHRFSKESLHAVAMSRPRRSSAHAFAVLALLITGFGLSAFFAASINQKSAVVSYGEETEVVQVAGVAVAPAQARSAERFQTAVPVYPPSVIADAFSDHVTVTTLENGKVEVTPIFHGREGNPVISD